MRKMYVPEIGDLITLAADWSFSLYSESRNVDLGLALGFVSSGKRWNCNLNETGFRMYSVKDAGTVTIPIGTVLKVERVYIRRSASEFSSLTFRIVETLDPRANADVTKKRFWAKLADVNAMEIED